MVLEAVFDSKDGASLVLGEYVFWDLVDNIEDHRKDAQCSAHKCMIRTDVQAC
jgi:hypothetical protein